MSLGVRVAQQRLRFRGSLLRASTELAISAIVVRESCCCRASTAGAVASRRTGRIWAPTGQDALGGDRCSVMNSPLSTAAKASRKVMSLAARASSKPPLGPSRARIKPAAVISEQRRRTTTGLVLVLSATSSEHRILPGLTASSQQMNANGKSGARRHRQSFARRRPALQSQPLRASAAHRADGAADCRYDYRTSLLRTRRQPRSSARWRLGDRRLHSNRRRLTKHRRRSRCRRRGCVDCRRRRRVNHRRRRARRDGHSRSRRSRRANHRRRRRAWRHRRRR